MLRISYLTERIFPGTLINPSHLLPKIKSLGVPSDNICWLYWLRGWLFFFLFQGSVLALDDSIVDGDQVDYLIKFCPTKEEMELLKVHFSSCSIPLWNIISFLVNCILVYQQYLFPSASYIDMVIFNFFRVIQAKRRT